MQPDLQVRHAATIPDSRPIRVQEERPLVVVALGKRRGGVVGAPVLHDVVAELERAPLAEDDVDDRHSGGHLRRQVRLREHRHCPDAAGVGGLGEIEDLLRGDVRRAGEYREDAIAGSVGVSFQGED